MRGAKAGFLFALVSLGLSCSLFRAKIAPYPSGVVFPVEEAARLSYDGKIVGAILREGSELFFSTDKGWLYCLDGPEKKIKWTYDAGSPIGCPPSVGPRSLCVWDQNNNISCLEKNGKLRWKIKVNENISSGISQDRERLYVGTETGNLLALSQNSGEMLWYFPTGGPVAAEAVFWEGRIIVGSADGKVYFLSSRGKRLDVIEAGSPVGVTPLVDGDRLYLGSDEAALQCFNLKTLRRKWKARTGGKLSITPRADDRRVFFIASNSVIFCLNKKSGEILWWQVLPSRSAYGLEFSQEKILVSSFSSVLVSLDRETGENTGTYDAGAELRSNPLWLDPFVLISHHDFRQNKGSIVFLGKGIKVTLRSSLASPQPAGAEISFTASAVGFYRPRYEFFLRNDEQQVVIQKESERNSCLWFPEKEGNYVIAVKVTDEKQQREAEIPFAVGKKEK